MRRLIVQDKTLPNRPPPCFCEECGASTRERKPFCPDHILTGGYAKRLFETLQGVEAEIDKVAKCGPSAVDLNGKVSEEILAGIASAGELAWRRLVKDRVAFLKNASVKTADAYLTRLKKAGLVEVYLSSRNTEIVMLSAKGLRWVQND